MVKPPFTQGGHDAGGMYIMKHAAFLKNVAVISAGGIIAKAIGAFYRIALVGH